MKDKIESEITLIDFVKRLIVTSYNRVDGYKTCDYNIKERWVFENVICETLLAYAKYNVLNHELIPTYMNNWECRGELKAYKKLRKHPKGVDNSKYPIEVRYLGLVMHSVRAVLTKFDNLFDNGTMSMVIQGLDDITELDFKNCMGWDREYTILTKKR